jgi:hypothetical protein
MDTAWARDDAAYGRLALLCALLCLPVAAQAADNSVQWSQGHLSVQAGPQSLGAVLQNIQSRTGIVIKSNQALQEPVRRGFKQLPLVQGLHQLLADHNHMIIEGQGRRPLRVIVLAGSGPVAGAAPARAAPGPSALQTALASSDPAQRIDAIERLGDLSDPANMAALQQALADPAEAVRAVAQQALQAGKPAPMPARKRRLP